MKNITRTMSSYISSNFLSTAWMQISCKEFTYLDGGHPRLMGTTCETSKNTSYTREKKLVDKAWSRMYVFRINVHGIILFFIVLSCTLVKLSFISIIWTVYQTRICHRVAYQPRILYKTLQRTSCIDCFTASIYFIA